MEDIVVSVVVPCRNEIGYIADFLASVRRQDYSADLIEIILVDGMSDDGTREYLEEITDSRVLVLDNPKLQVSEALNLAIKRSKGSVVVRLDVHCVFPKDYISTLVAYLLTGSEVGNVGVPCVTLPGGTGEVAVAISLVLSTPIGVGGSSFRVDSPETPKSVDTVPFGCWRRDLFDQIGYFDTDLTRNQDDEFNQRILKHGLKIHLLPGPRVVYFGRDKLLSHLKMFYQYGLFKPLVNRKIGKVTTLRQLAPASLVLFLLSLCSIGSIFPTVSIVGFLTTVCGYLTAAAYVLRNYSGSRARVYIPFVCCVVMTHLAYGVGYLEGLFFGSNNRKISLSR